MDRKTRTVFQLDTPYSLVHWPAVSSENQQIIIDLLTSLLSPIGRHRGSYVISSKGKRSRKRKRQEAKLVPRDVQNVAVRHDVPPLPEISKHVLVGLGSVTRHLEALSNLRKGTTSLKSPEPDPPDSMQVDHPVQIKAGDSLQHVAAVFVTRSTQPSILNSHLPQLIANASLANPNLPPIRLVQLPKGCEESLHSSLGLPLVGFVAVMTDAPHSSPLIDFVKQNVEVVEVQWLKEAQAAQYIPVKINAIQTPVSAPKKEKPKIVIKKR